jgi:hypothetical protein
MAKEKLQNKGQTMHWPKKWYKQSNGKRKSTK